MSKLNAVINGKIQAGIGNLNTLMLCKVTQITPYLEIISYFDAKYTDGESQPRTKIQKPMTMSGATFKVGDIVLVGFLQEYVEGGATRRFDISDAVVIGKVSL